jgi:hypothetical protein
MKNKKLLILVGLLVLISLIYLLFTSQQSEEITFKPIVLEEKNSIVNNSMPSYYDTILHVGLGLAGIEGVTVTVEELSETAKQQFDGELNAHIRYFEGKFYLFIDRLNRKEAITVISHEIIHIQQYLDGSFQYDNGNITWNGGEYLLEDINYDDRPWEDQAFQMQGPLSSQILDVVYQ